MLNFIKGGWGMSVSSKGCKFKHPELLIRFESFNDECAMVKLYHRLSELVVKYYFD